MKMREFNTEAITAIFFDLDGTLSDYVGGVEHALEIVWDGIAGKLAPHGKQSFLDSYWRNFDEMEGMARRGEITTVEASSRKGRFTRILREFGLEHDHVLIEEMSELYTKGRLLGARLFPGVTETLAALRNMYSLSVVTEGNGKIQREQIRRLGLDGVFHHIIVSQEACLHKPDPALYNYALVAAGASPSQSVMVGDRVDWDLVPAKQLGFRTAFFTLNNRYLALKEEMQFEPDWEIGDFRQLLEIFRSGDAQ
jgi:putative hydrolase of the HAD superfamily